jgi:transcriptional regulator with PAS, ATPase and Fis domain
LNHPELPAKKIVTINCGSIPEKLIESEFYGFYQGAHSGATKDMKGKLEAADQGVAFLDEVETISLHAQAALLRFLENREIQKLGQSDKEASPTINIEAIVLLGTNEELNQLVEENKMRRDFYARIAMVDIRIPPLRERKEDIRELTKYFITKECVKQKLPEIDLSDELYRQLETYDWPGNVRELRELISSIVMLTEEEKIITKFPQPEKIEKIYRQSTKPLIYEAMLDEIIGSDWKSLGYEERRDSMVRWMLQEEYEANNYNASAMARKLKVSPSTMQGRLDRLKITKPK